MTIFLFITLILNPFSKLEAENELLLWELAEKRTEYRHLVREYEMQMFREHLNSMDIVNQISISNMEE